MLELDERRFAKMIHVEGELFPKEFGSRIEGSTVDTIKRVAEAIRQASQ